MAKRNQTSWGAGCSVEELEGRMFLSATGVGHLPVAEIATVAAHAREPLVASLLSNFPLFSPPKSGGTTPTNSTPTPRDDDNWVDPADEDLDNDWMSNDNDSDDDGDGLQDNVDPDDDNDGTHDDQDLDDDGNGVNDDEEPEDLSGWFDGEDGFDVDYVEAQMKGRGTVKAGKAYKFKVVFTSDEPMEPSELIGATVRRPDGTLIDAKVLKIKRSKNGLKLTVSHEYSSATGEKFTAVDNGVYKLATAADDEHLEVTLVGNDEPEFTNDDHCVLGSFVVAAK